MTWLILLTALISGACASPQAASRTGSEGSARPSAVAKAIVVAINEDPKNFWDGINGGGGGGAREIGHMVNQYLANVTPEGAVIPRLLAELPSLERGTWRVSPDGSMEVTYNIRPGVTWHDGVPFTADDMILSWEVGRDPALSSGNRGALRLISNIVALDANTAVASWTQTYAFADRLEHREFFPLPKHLVEQPYRESKDTLIAQPYFSTGYVGLGPFKLTSWDHGSAMELAANDKYFLGRPKLDRIRVLFIGDPNTAVANLRAGTLNGFLPSGGPDWDRLKPLKSEWDSTKKGEVVLERVRWAFTEVQKSAAAQPADLTDARMRRALQLATNREELTRSMQGEYGGVADSWVHPSFAYYPAVRDVITQYPYDSRQAVALLAELGWTPGSDGILQKGGNPFNIVVRSEEVRQKEAAIVQQDWKLIGIQGSLEVMSNVLLRDAEARASFTGVALNQNPLGGASAVRRFATDQIPLPANRFAGTNRGAFSNAEWDEVGLRLRTSLTDDDRLQHERQLLRVFTAELPALPIEYELQAVPVSGFKGMLPVVSTPHTGNIMHTTAVHEWDLL